MIRQIFVMEKNDDDMMVMTFPEYKSSFSASPTFIIGSRLSVLFYGSGSDTRYAYLSLRTKRFVLQSKMAVR